MIITDHRVIYVYEHDQPIPEPKEDLGTVTMLFYYAPTWGDFFKSETFKSIRPLLKSDFSWIIINDANQNI